MISIGEFAISTGISIKTLRYYDEIGLLAAAEVDAATGYRSYSATQLGPATLLRVLRAAGLSIAQMKQALTQPDHLDELLDQRRKELAVQRCLEDWALDQAPTWQQIDPGTVQRRQCPPQPWAGVETTFDLREQDDRDHAVEQGAHKLEAAFEQLWGAVARAGHDPRAREDGSHFWVQMRADPGRSTLVHLAYCLALDGPAPAGLDLPGATVISGTLPERIEVYVTIPLDPDGESSPEEHLAGGPLAAPASIALAQAAEVAGAEREPVRQRSIVTQEGGHLEFCVTIDELG